MNLEITKDEAVALQYAVIERKHGLLECHRKIREEQGREPVEHSLRTLRALILLQEKLKGVIG